MAIRGTLDDFKASIVNDFARPNLFQVDLAFPTGIINDASLTNLGKFTVRAANLPASQIGVIEVPFRGRVLKIAGDRTFEPWTITIMNDTKFTLRNAFELWANSIQASHWITCAVKCSSKLILRSKKLTNKLKMRLPQVLYLIQQRKWIPLWLLAVKCPLKKEQHQK